VVCSNLAWSGEPPPSASQNHFNHCACRSTGVMWLWTRFCLSLLISSLVWEYNLNVCIQHEDLPVTMPSLCACVCACLSADRDIRLGKRVDCRHHLIHFRPPVSPTDRWPRPLLLQLLRDVMPTMASDAGAGCFVSHAASLRRVAALCRSGGGADTVVD